jgi:tetratricopeptide (TPR) repeat protein
MLKSSGSTPEFLRSLRNQAWLLSLLLVAATLLAYQPAWCGKPIWDDGQHMTPPGLRSMAGLARIWTQPGATQQYYPLIYSAFWMENKLWGDSTLGYHLVNILLHAASALLVVKILQKLEVPGAWLAAGIFALHPVQVESVAWISELKNTLSGVFYLGSALAYLKFDQIRSRKFFAAALGLFILGLLSKTVIATLPAALLLIFWWKRGRLFWKRDMLPLVPFFLVGIGAGLFTAWFEQKVLHAEGQAYDFSFIERILIAGRALWFYLGSLCWPSKLVFIYPRWDVSQGVWWQYLFPAAMLLLLAALWWMRRWRGPLAGSLFFAGTLFPALGFINLYPFRYSFVANHFQYLASLGIITLASAGAALLLGRWRFWGRVGGNLLCLTLLATLASLTWRQGRMYTDAETLWRTTIARNPDAWMAHDNLGIVLFQQGQVDKAILQFQKALDIKPDDVVTRKNLGIALLLKGQEREALVQFQKVLAIQPDDALARNNLGQILLQKGQEREALIQFQKVLENDPREPMANYNIGNFLLAKRRVDEAIVYFQKSLSVQPGSVLARNNLGTALLLKGQEREALVQFQKALEYDPGDPTAHYNIGLVLCQKGRMDEGIMQFQKALESRPDFAEAHNNLGNAFLQKGLVDEAIAHFQKALEIRPDFADARDNLDNAAWLLATSPEASLRNGPKALALARQLDRLSGGNNPAILDTLAAACAENGQFPEAVDAAQRALELARSHNNTTLADTLRQQIKLLQSGSPLRSAPQTEAAPGLNQP